MTPSQGGSCLATLGFETESLQDSPTQTSIPYITLIEFVFLFCGGERSITRAPVTGLREMTSVEFKRKWSRFSGKESAAYQEHFNDLCRLLGQPTPIEADPSGNDFFCFQKRVVKDAELFDTQGSPDEGDPTERGFADVWKKDCFGWEYKGKKKNLDDAYKQLLRYRESLLNPPLLVVCDFDRYIVRTNFNGTVQEKHEFTNDQIDRPENLRILRSLFADPDYLKPQRTTAQVTEKLAGQIAASRPAAPGPRERRIGRRQNPRGGERGPEAKSYASPGF